MGKPFYYFSKGLFTFVRPFYPTKVLGKENIMKKGKCIYASNHLSSMDIPMLQLHLPGFRRFIGKKEYAEKKLAKYSLSHFGVIFIDRDKPELSAMRTIFKVLDDDGQIMIFPEGTRNREDDKQMLELKGGLAIFAMKSGAPVIPVLMHHRPKAFRKNYIYIGKPLDLCENKGRLPNPEQVAALTARYSYEFAKLRVIMNDYVEMKRWKKKNRLAEGAQSPALTAWLAEHPDPSSLSDKEEQPVDSTAG